MILFAIYIWTFYCKIANCFIPLYRKIAKLPRLYSIIIKDFEKRRLCVEYSREIYVNRFTYSIFCSKISLSNNNTSLALHAIRKPPPLIYILSIRGGFLQYKIWYLEQFFPTLDSIFGAVFSNTTPL